MTNGHTNKCLSARLLIAIPGYAFFAAGVVLAGIICMESSPARAERVCVTQECWTAECRPIPGGRRCRRVCRRRCYDDAPHYIQPRRPDPPAYRYAQPQKHYTQPRVVPPIDPELAVLAGIALLVGFIAFIAHTFTRDTTAKQIAEIEQSSRSLREEAQDEQSKTQAINDHITSAEADAFRQGQRRAEEDWQRRFTRHD